MRDASKPVIVYWASKQSQREEVHRDEQAAVPTRQPGGALSNAPLKPRVLLGEIRERRR
jgi:hypothetical protein